MTTPRVTADTAVRVADRLRPVEPPWDVYGERIVTHEVHFGPRGVELVRGPLVLEGYGVRLLRPKEGKTAIGFNASTDTSDSGVAEVLAGAQSVARYSEFPAKDVQLPSGAGAGSPAPAVVDPHLWDNAPLALAQWTGALFAAFERSPDASVSFGSVKSRRVEATLSNSAGLSTGYAHTEVELEVAIKSAGGPEGAPAGEYWVTSFARRLEPERLPELAEQWSRFARDARHARPPPTGDLNVVLPPNVLEAILPQALSFKLSGRGRLRELSPAPGAEVASEGVDLFDDGTLPWAIGSSPVDDEGIPQRRRALIESGKSSELLYDTLYANALGGVTSGNGLRAGLDLTGRERFARIPGPACTTVSIPAGSGGSDRELIEAAGDGIWIQQIGWPSPDPITSGFGGEIRIGYRIRNGKLAEPVRGGTVGGLVLGPPGAPSLLANISVVGSSPVLTGGVSVPPLLVRGLTVAGEDVPGATASA